MGCKYCDEEMLKYETGGECLQEFGKGYAIEHGDIKAFIEKKDGKYYLTHRFTPADLWMKIEIHACPICARKFAEVQNG